MSGDPTRGRWRGRLAVLALTATLLPGVASGQQDPSPQQSGVEVEGLFPESRFIARAIDFAARTIGDGSAQTSGFYPEMANMITGAGWISLGPGYRRWFGGDRVFTDVSAALSWRSYRMVRGRVELTNLAHSRLATGGEVKWQDFTQNTYFGEGPDSDELNRSEYRLKSLDAVVYANVRPARWLTVGARAGWLRSPSLLDPSGRFRRDVPPMAQVFPDEPAWARAEQPDYAHGELSVTADTRDHRSHPLSGGVYRGSWTRFAERGGGNFDFQRFEAEALQVKTWPSARLTLVAHGWLAASDTAEGREVPFYLMPSLGGSNTLKSFANYRYHDRHFVVANLEARVALLDHLDGVLFVDAGDVAPRMAGLTLDKRSLGVGFRVHSTTATFGRLDIAHGSEGWRFTFSTSDPLHLSRLSRRMAPVPFVP